MKSAVLVALLMWLCSCEKPKHECPLEEELEAIRNTNYAKSYHIHNLYARIDSMQKRLMWLEDSIAFNAPSDWSSSISASEDAGAYPPTKKKPVEWSAGPDIDYGKPPKRVPNTTWIRPYPKGNNVYRSAAKVKKDEELLKQMADELPYFPTGTQQGVGAHYDGREAISTAAWYNGNILEFLLVTETDDKYLQGRRSFTGDVWWVKEINDSVKNAQRAYSDSIIAAHIKKLKK